MNGGHDHACAAGLLDAFPDSGHGATMMGSGR